MINVKIVENLAKKMKGIKALKHKHKGKDIYVIGSGSSLNWVPPSFFKNKITIGINHVYRKYRTTYLVGKEPAFYKKALLKLKNNMPHILITKMRNGNFGHGENTKWIEEEDRKYVSLFEHKDNKRTAINVTRLDQSIIVSWSTMTTAMHLAAYMGASNILLCGHDCGTIDGKRSFDGYHITLQETPWKNWGEYVSWLSKIENQSIKAKVALSKHYGCNIFSLNPFINFNLENHKFTKKQVGGGKRKKK